MFLNPIKKSKTWLKEAVTEFIDNGTSLNPKELLISPIPTLILLFISIPLVLGPYNKYRFDKKSLELYLGSFVNRQIRLSEGIDTVPQLKDEWESKLFDDLYSLENIFKNKLTPAQLGQIAAISRDLKMSPFRLVALLNNMNKISFLDFRINGLTLEDYFKSSFGDLTSNKSKRIIIELKNAIYLAMSEPFVERVFKEEYAKRSDLEYRKDISPKLKLRLKEIQRQQNSLLARFEKESLWDVLKQQRLERTRRILKERSLPKLPEKRLKNPRNKLKI